MIRYNPLWETMKKKSITQYQLIKDYGISAGQLSRLRKNTNVSTHTLDQLCRILKCSLSDVAEYIAVKGYHFSAEEFMDYYDSVGWMQHGEPIRNWQVKCRTFERVHNSGAKTNRKNTGSRVVVPMPKIFNQPADPGETDEKTDREQIEQIKRLQEQRSY